MRKIIVFAFLFIFMAFCVDDIVKKDYPPDMDKRLMEWLNAAPLAEYKDRDFGFVAYYPDVFVKNNDTTGRYFGCSRFDFWQLSIECYVVYDRQERGFKAYMDSIATAMKADSCRRHGDSFIVSSSLYEDGMLVDGFRYYANTLKATTCGLSMPCIILRLIVSHSAVCLILLTDGRYGNKRHFAVIENFTDGKPLMKTSEICWHIGFNATAR